METGCEGVWCFFYCAVSKPICRSHFGSSSHHLIPWLPSPAAGGGGGLGLFGVWLWPGTVLAVPSGACGYPGPPSLARCPLLRAPCRCSCARKNYLLLPTKPETCVFTCICAFVHYCSCVREGAGVGNTFVYFTAKRDCCCAEHLVTYRSIYHVPLCQVSC